MSQGLSAFLEGWHFRTSTPSFQPGEELVLDVSSYDPEREAAVIRVGDSVLYLNNGEEEHVHCTVRIRIEGFDRDVHRGTAEVLDIIKQPAF